MIPTLLAPAQFMNRRRPRMPQQRRCTGLRAAADPAAPCFRVSLAMGAGKYKSAGNWHPTGMSFAGSDSTKQNPAAPTIYPEARIRPRARNTIPRKPLNLLGSGRKL